MQASAGYGNGDFIDYGGIQDDAALRKGFWVPPRRRLNWVPMAVCWLCPWVLFVVVYTLSAFNLRYTQPTICNAIVFALLAGVLCVGVRALAGKLRLFKGQHAEREPTWLIFFFISLLLAWFLGYEMGTVNFRTNMGPYYDLGMMNNYTMVYPNRLKGSQVMDAGIVEFAPGTRLDIKKSMGFKNKDIYCVVPIVFGTSPLETYDFWAVGTDCCSGNQADFHCLNYNNPEASGGIRMMSSGDRAYYRLAVQQAEAFYNIKASHPLFFTWSVHPSQKADAMKDAGHAAWLSWVVSYLFAQLFVVLVATVIFSRIGSF